MRTRITGIGFHVPPRVVTNHGLAQVMDTSDEWIVERTGIRERRFVDPGTGTTDLARLRRALSPTPGRMASDLDFILLPPSHATFPAAPRCSITPSIR